MSALPSPHFLTPTIHSSPPGDDDSPAVVVSLDRCLKSGRLDQVYITPAEALRLAAGLVKAAIVLIERKS